MFQAQERGPLIFKVSSACTVLTREGEPQPKTTPQSNEPVDGTIVNGNWQQGPIYKMVTFAGDGYVDCGNGITFSSDAQFSIGHLA